MTDDEQPLYHPGQTVKDSGVYTVLDADGNDTGLEVTPTEGEPFPPQQVKGYHYRLARRTHHAEDERAAAHGDEPND